MIGLLDYREEGLLYRMADTIPVSLAISLHAPSDELRDVLVPINQKYPIKELMKACQYYLNAGTQERHIFFEYVMLDGVNDLPEHAKSLARLLKGISAKVNLIPFNPFPKTQYQTSKEVTINQFQNILYRSGIRTTTRRTRGDDVDAACGQLAGKVLDRYYPKRKKRLKPKLFLLLLLILIFLGIWYYFEDVEIGGNRSTSIIISEPSNFESSEESITENIEEVSSTTIIDNNTESLDEAIKTYEASTQN